MESRLKILQERMQQQRLEDESISKPGGARWRSARNDKGSILSYNKDIQVKYEKKREKEGGGDPALWISSSTKNSNTQLKETASKSDFRQKGLIFLVNI